MAINKTAYIGVVFLVLGEDFSGFCHREGKKRKKESNLFKWMGPSNDATGRGLIREFVVVRETESLTSIECTWDWQWHDSWLILKQSCEYVCVCSRCFNSVSIEPESGRTKFTRSENLPLRQEPPLGYWSDRMTGGGQRRMKMAITRKRNGEALQTSFIFLPHDECCVGEVGEREI